MKKLEVKKTSHDAEKIHEVKNACLRQKKL